MKLLEEIIYILVAILIIVWPMDHMIAVRNIDIGLIFILSIINLFIKKQHIKIYFDKFDKVLIYLLIFFATIILLTSYFSSFFPRTFQEIKGQFWAPLLLGISGFLLIKSNIEVKKLFNYIFFAFFVLVAYHFLFSINYYLLNHTLPLRSFGVTKGLDELNFLMPYIFAFFAVEFIFRLLKFPSIIKLNSLNLLILFLIAVFSLFVQFKRNGVFSLMFLVVSMIFFVFFMLRKKISVKKLVFPFILVSFVSIIVITLDLKYDKRWDSLYGTYNLVFVKNDMTWYQKKVPHGYFSSNYRRLFYLRESIKFIKENPFGYGFSREIFSEIASKKYNLKNFHDHAHSSLLNILLGEGVLGFILYSLIMFLLMYIGIKNFLKYESYFGLFLFYIVSSFYFRSYLDDIFKNHYLQQFVFISVLAFFAMKREIYENKVSSIKEK